MKLQMAMGTYSHGKLPDLQYKGVPFVSQNHINLCGDACVNMLFLFYDVTPPAEVGQEGQDKRAVSTTVMQKRNKNDLADLPGGPGDSAGVYMMTDNPRGVLDGLDQGSAYSALNSAGLNPSRFDAGGNSYSTEQIEAVLDISPFMASVQFSSAALHAILIFGIKNDTLFYHDPWRGADMSMPLQKFNDVSPKDKNIVQGSLLAVGKFNPQKVDVYAPKFSQRYKDLGMSTLSIPSEKRGVALP